MQGRTRKPQVLEETPGFAPDTSGLPTVPTPAPASPNTAEDFRSSVSCTIQPRHTPWPDSTGLRHVDKSLHQFSMQYQKNYSERPKPIFKHQLRRSFRAFNGIFHVRSPKRSSDRHQCWENATRPSIPSSYSQGTGSASSDCPRSGIVSPRRSADSKWRPHRRCNPK